jgi:hypothetical protein
MSAQCPRAMIKLASLLAAAMVLGVRRARGVTDPAAGLAAEGNCGVWIAFERLIDDTDQRDLSHHILDRSMSLRP